MSRHVNENYATAQQLLGSVTRPHPVNATARVLEPGDHSDVIAAAQVSATLAAADALFGIADELLRIRMIRDVS